MNKQNHAVVVVGMTGSGKSVVSDFFKTKNYHYLRIGQITDDEVARRGLTLTEATARAVREELRAKEGMAAYVKLSWPKIQELLKSGPVVIDGLYSWSEYLFLKEKLGDHMTVIAVAAPRALRYERLAVRPERPFTREEAESRDYSEIENIEKGGPIAIADFTVVNDTSKDKLYTLLQEISDKFT